MAPKNKFVEWQRFLTYDIWHVNTERFPVWQRTGIKILRISILAVKDYLRKNLSLRASGLTLYSLMSIVPVLAMVFGIAKGFGLEEYLDEQLKKSLGAQPVILENVLTYAHNMLGSVKGGVIAGMGFALLLWSVIQVLSSIEDAFNSIWYVHQPRTWVRKFTDYLSIMLLAPLFIVISGAVNIFISTQIHHLVQHLSFLGSTITELIVISIQILPFVTTSILLFFVYQVMPNTRVKPSAALTAGIIAGCVFQLFQWAYIAFQIGVSRYNTIYGSFASIPLFITWLQFSWMIVLIGAEISYSVQNISIFEAEQQTGKISHKMRMLYAIYVLHYISKKFKTALPAPDAVEIARKLKLPLNLCRKTLSQLQSAGLVTSTVLNEKTKEYSYVPALDIALLNLGFIINKLESDGELKKHEGGDDDLFYQIKLHYLKLEEAINKSSANKNILDLQA